MLSLFTKKQFNGYPTNIKKKLYLIIITIIIGLFQSCVSKKQILYLQDLDTLNNLELKYNNHTLQVDDILKISVGALMPEAALPYNNRNSW